QWSLPSSIFYLLSSFPGSLRLEPDVQTDARHAPLPAAVVGLLAATPLFLSNAPSLRHSNTPSAAGEASLCCPGGGLQPRHLPGPAKQRSDALAGRCPSQPAFVQRPRFVRRLSPEDGMADRPGRFLPASRFDSGLAIGGCSSAHHCHFLAGVQPNQATALARVRLGVGFWHPRARAWAGARRRNGGGGS